ncbi:UDP-glycosyltransferase 76F1-like [Senna tora]|uniref:UDP-glycosyltransferase 76F1-like n=1 Tax=Senna tora TaxID=362788 RepID=A0A834TFI0_9FABA|nr:UDP-glycosyltransferase 76F1-like [Senna tora]
MSDVMDVEKMEGIRRGRRLLLIPLPLEGHINPMLELAHILHSKGFSISFIHIQYCTNSLNFTFSISSFPHGPLPLPQPSSDLLNFLTLLNTLALTPFRDCLAKLLSHDASSEDEEDQHPISCLISDAMCFFTQAVATSFGLPRIVLRTGAISSFLAFAAFPLLLQKRYLPIQECQLEKVVEELGPLRVKDLPVVNTNDPHKFYDLLRNFVHETVTSLGVIWNSFEALESSSLAKLTHQFPTPMYAIGPLHKYLQPSQMPHPHQSCISWLQQHAPKSVVYVSFGSIASISEADFLEIAWGLANCDHPFLWVVRPGMVRGCDWLEALPSGFLENLGGSGRGHIVKWAPQQQVLAHHCVGAFLTHNGWNSTMESICEGVPMICMPCFADQNVNARYVSHVWKVGLQLEKGVERGEIERSIRKVMEGKEIRERASILKEEARLCLQRGGSSYSSLQRLVTHIMSFNVYSPSH